MSGPTTDVECPVCRQRVALTRRRQLLTRHRDQKGDVCRASGQRPASDRVRSTARRSDIKRIGKTALALIVFLVFTVLAGTLGILDYFGIAPENTPERPALRLRTVTRSRGRRRSGAIWTSAWPPRTARQ